MIDQKFLGFVLFLASFITLNSAEIIINRQLKDLNKQAIGLKRQLKIEPDNLLLQHLLKNIGIEQKNKAREIRQILHS